jgi:hypothetical protein
LGEVESVEGCVWGWPPEERLWDDLVCHCCDIGLDLGDVDVSKVFSLEGYVFTFPPLFEAEAEADAMWGCCLKESYVLATSDSLQYTSKSYFTEIPLQLNDDPFF